MASDPDDSTIDCPFCLAPVPAAATRCRHCGSELGGSASPNLAGFWFGGVILAVVGVAIAAAGSDAAWFGILVASVGGVLLQIAIIAAGVSLGVRDRDAQALAVRLGRAAKAADDGA